MVFKNVGLALALAQNYAVKSIVLVEITRN